MYNVVYTYQLSPQQQAWEDAENAQARGDLKKKKCSACGSTQNVEMHHPKINQTTRVRWLCKSCHKKHHLVKG